MHVVAAFFPSGVAWTHAGRRLDLVTRTRVATLWLESQQAACSVFYNKRIAAGGHTLQAYFFLC